MRPMMLVVLLLTTLTSTAYAQAATTTPERPLKIGYIDMARALNEVEDGKSAKARLKTDFDDKQKKLDKMQNDLKAKKEDFDKKSGAMDPEAKAKRQEELQRSFLDLQRTYMELQKELSDREAQVTSEIAEKIRRIIAILGDRDGFHLIMNLGDTVLYYKRHQDVTDEVVREYNRQFAGKK